MGNWLLDIGLDCSSAAIPASNLSPLTSQHGSPLADIDCQGSGGSKQQHHPWITDRVTLLLITCITTTCQITAVGGGVLPIVAFALSIAIYRIVVAGERGLKWLIHCGLIRIVRWLLCIVIATIRSTIRCVGARVVWRVALRGGIYLRR